MTPTTFRREDLGDGMGSSNANQAAQGTDSLAATASEPSASHTPDPLRPTDDVIENLRLIANHFDFLGKVLRETKRLRAVGESRSRPTWEVAAEEASVGAAFTRAAIAKATEAQDA